MHLSTSERTLQGLISCGNWFFGYVRNLSALCWITHASGYNKESHNTIRPFTILFFSKKSGQFILRRGTAPTVSVQLSCTSNLFSLSVQTTNDNKSQLQNDEFICSGASFSHDWHQGVFVVHDINVHFLMKPSNTHFLFCATSKLIFYTGVNVWHKRLKIGPRNQNSAAHVALCQQKLAVLQRKGPFQRILPCHVMDGDGMRTTTITATLAWIHWPLLSVSAAEKTLMKCFIIFSKHSDGFWKLLVNIWLFLDGIRQSCTGAITIPCCRLKLQPKW